MTKPLLKQLAPLFIIGFGLLVFILLQLTATPVPPPPSAERVWRVQTVTVEIKKHSPSLTLYGKIETPALVSAAAPTNSQVMSIQVREGSAIETGQLLLTLDERDFEPRVRQANARAAELRALIQSEQSRHQADKLAFADEQALLKLEQSAVKRAELLKKQKLGSTSALEQAQQALKRQQLTLTSRKLALNDHTARLQQLNARLAYAEADVTLAELDLERSKIIAPFNGFVEQLMVTEGDQVKENQILLSFYATEQLEIRAKIPAVYQKEIQQALYNKQPLTANADYAGVTLNLRLNRLSGMADARGIDALFEIVSGSQWVRPGGSISLTLKRPAQENVIALPYAALYDNNRIYRVVNQRLEMLTVDIAGNYINGESEQILVICPELKQGDEILITPLPNAIHGLKVEPMIKP